MQRSLLIVFMFSFFIGSAQLKKEYYDNEQTQLKSETDYYRGMPHGPFYEYYKNGKVSRKGYYYRGKEDSVWTFYFDDGNTKAIERFSRGKKNGTNVYYFRSGKIAQITKFTLAAKKNVYFDLADSVWTAFHENGKVKSRETFVNGKKQGEWVY